MMILSDRFFALQRHKEALHLEAYPATKNEEKRRIYTIGWGHTKGVTKYDRITLDQAEEFLQSDAREAQYSAAPYLTDIALTQSQYDAIISMCFNVGPDLFINEDGSDTGIYRALKQGAHTRVMHQMRRWKYQQGKVLDGLLTRRGMEEMLYLIGTTEEKQCD